jgi:7-cyano-7-deazaguanine synthase
MSIVTLVSGGMDSSLMALMAKEDNIMQHPLFIDYGQIGCEREYRACRAVHSAHGLPTPARMDLSGFGKTISSGLTDRSKDIYADAFLPGRNMLFLLAGSAYAHNMNANAVSIGLLNEKTHLFPDQTSGFISQIEKSISMCMGIKINIIAPLMSFYKIDVIRLANKFNLTETYSCHSGNEKPCGICISSREILSAKKKEV